MKIEDKLRYLAENTDQLSDKNSKIISSIYTRVKYGKSARNEQNELVKDLLLSTYEINERIAELRELQDLLDAFSRKNGLKHSLFSINELLTLINAEIQAKNDNIFDNQESVTGIRELLKENQT